MKSGRQTIPASIIENGREGEITPVDLAWTGGDGPLVSCLMVTRGHVFPAKFAIACFQNQTYENCELIIVIDDSASALIPHVASLQDARIRLVEVSAGEKTLGELRNISVANARGEYVCQWDDDDLYAPERIQIQLAALLATQASACVLRRWILWWPAVDRLAISGTRRWEGSILALKRVMPPYPALRRGEDTEMMDSVMLSERILSLDAPDLYVYIYHGNNTFNQQHFFSIYNFSRQRWLNNAYWKKLESLARTLPIREYRDALPVYEQLNEEKRSATQVFPLVSIIVRSMGRPELRLALESLAAQDYPALDVIVVDATGGAHPPLPEIAWRSGHEVRLVGGGQPLLRPHAANVGLDAVRGEWFGFLDDDDSFDADHVSVLMKGASSTDKLVVYGLTRLVDSSGETISLSGLPFNRAIMFHDAILCFPTALIRRSVLSMDFRFDERLEISEDRDFFSQIAEYSDFEHVRHVSFNYCVELGTSGTGRLNNRDIAKLLRFEQLLRCKWFGIGRYHIARATNGCKKAISAYNRGDSDEARAAFDAVLREYPDDPNALSGLGYIALMNGELAEAERVLRRALEINPAAGEFRLHLATTLERAGFLSGARKEAWMAASDPRVREAALKLLSRLGGPPPQLASNERPVAPETVRPSRMEICPCGSGKRYKHCCGQFATAMPPANPSEEKAQSALAAFRSGDAFVAIEIVTCLLPADLMRARTALDCGNICTEMARYEEAYAFFRRAADLGETTRAAEGVTRACQHWYKPERDASTRRMVARLIERFNRRAPHADTGQIPEIHIVANLGRFGGSEHRALHLFCQLARQVRAQVWSTVPPMPEFLESYPIQTIDVALGRHPRSGHLVFIGAYFEYGSWLNQCLADRITLCYNTDSPAGLIERLVELEGVATAFSLDFSFPSRQFRDAVGMDGRVEYPVVDVGRFSPVRRSSRPGPMAIGRHSRDDGLKFHPNDPALFRRLAGLGHEVRIMGGTCLAAPLERNGPEVGITLLPAAPNGVVGFLQELDCFIYRTHPHWYETGGTVILEAMAMSLPVVLFGERVGMVEVIEHGKNGFIVQTEEEALAWIAQLTLDPELRRTTGEAARATVVKVMEAQTDAILDFYVHGGKSGADGGAEYRN
jgi:glycosyltransferase involved in cell wall biosynthesis